jgi:hypothetical protein
VSIHETRDGKPVWRRNDRETIADLEAAGMTDEQRWPDYRLLYVITTEAGERAEVYLHTDGWPSHTCGALVIGDTREEHDRWHEDVVMDL